MNPRELKPEYIKAVASNMRFRWPEETKEYSDMALAYLYDDFSTTDDVGNNDEKLSTWFEMLPEYEKHVATFRDSK